MFPLVADGNAIRAFGESGRAEWFRLSTFKVATVPCQKRAWHGTFVRSCFSGEQDGDVSGDFLYDGVTNLPDERPTGCEQGSKNAVRPVFSRPSGADVASCAGLCS